MSIIQLIILLFTGVGIGFLSGLLGIGGGIIMTPVQYWIYTSAGMNPDLAIKISFATSLAVILPTAASGVWRHQRQGNINWRAATFMGIFTAIGGFIGATIATHISGSVLKVAFGVILLLIAIRMITVKVFDVQRPVKENLWLWFALALPIGILTGILGIGGGVFVVPMLVLILGFCMRNATATSLAMMLFTSLGGIAGYIVNGLNAPNLPGYTLGYINWPAWIALTVGSIGMAQVGALVAHKVSGKILTYILVALQIYISLEMLGAFSWISAHL
jgi:hypothetical protein